MTGEPSFSSQPGWVRFDSIPQLQIDDALFYRLVYGLPFVAGLELMSEAFGWFGSLPVVAYSGPVSGFLILGSGLLAGATHVALGVDHLAALLPLAVGRRRAFGIGARWGLGHSSGVGVIALAGIALVHQVDVAPISTLAERFVGLMLVALGVLGVRRALRIELHSHVHEHDGEAHAHLHAHSPQSAHASGPDPTPGAHTHRHTAFLAGTLHGIAGTAHLLGVLPALALPGWQASIGYLVAFALGTVAAMGTFTMTVGALSEDRDSLPLRKTLCATSALTIAVGVVWMAGPTLGIALP